MDCLKSLKFCRKVNKIGKCTLACIITIYFTNQLRAIKIAQNHNLKQLQNRNANDQNPRDLSRNQKLVPLPKILYTDYYTKLNPPFIILRENFIKIIIMLTAIGEMLI